MRFPTARLEDVLETLIDYRGKTPTKTSAGVRLITAKVIKDGFINDSSFEYVAEDEYDSWMRRGLPKVGDLLVTTEAPLGEVAIIVEERVALAQRVILLRADRRKMNPRFLFHAFKSSFVQAELRKRATGTTVLGIKQSELREIQVPSPSLSTQQRIADVLSPYDDLIENNTKRIKILEEMARSLYREWFVEFRFPGHESLKLTASPLGHVPQNWHVAPLASGCASLADGDWIETKDQGGSDYRLLQVSNIGRGCFVETGNFRFITSETFVRLRCTEVQAGDILVSRMPTPIGRAWLVHQMPWRLITAVDVAILRPNPDVLSAHFTELQMNDDGFLARAGKHAGGATRPRITRRDLSSLPFLFPDISVQRRFVDLYAPMREQIRLLRAAAEEACVTRDLLLPRLLSGEIELRP